MLRVYLLIIVILLFVSGTDAWWCKNKFDELERAEPGDTFTVRFMCDKTAHKNVMGLDLVNMQYHTAIQFFNNRNGYHWITEVWATPTMYSTLFPVLEKKDGKNTIRWNSGSDIRMCSTWGIYGKEVDEYWDSGNNIDISIINAEQHNKLVDFLIDYHKRKVQYKLFGLVKQWDKTDPSKREFYKKGFVCADYVWTIINKLKGYGATFNVTTLKRDFINMYLDKPPQRVDINDPDVVKDIIDTYGLLQVKPIHNSILKELHILYLFLKGKFYANFDGEYYLFNFKKWGIEYVDSLLSDQINDPQSYDLPNK
jgi:hypothetical protein